VEQRTVTENYYSEVTMPYRLKPGVPDFETVDGPMAGRKFEAGKEYDAIPREEADRFEPINAPEPEMVYTSPIAPPADPIILGGEAE
jgi:hypothetical protein